jgi:ribonuclease III
MQWWCLKNTSMSNDNLEEFEELFNQLEEEFDLKFKDRVLLFRCLVHDSYVYENLDIQKSNERLEFLGDAVLGLVISHLLFNRYPDWDEGNLALLKSRLVSATSLAERAREFNLGKFLFLGRGEEASGGRNRISILADTLEAFIGAVYLDQGFDNASKLVEKLFINCLDVELPPKDYKSQLQEYSQREFKALPVYSVVFEEGPPHQKLFRVKVRVGEKLIGEGEGSSKKEAEQNAAKIIVESLELTGENLIQSDTDSELTEEHF